jgi:hypothetical protein
VDVEELGRRSLEAQEAAYAIGDRTRIEEAQDLEAEFRARKLEPPLPSKEVIDRMASRVEQLKDNPDAREARLEAIRTFYESIEKKPD